MIERLGALELAARRSVLGLHEHAATFDGERFSFAAGRTSRANLAGSGSATLLWSDIGGPYTLIVDGDAHIAGDDEPITVTPTLAVLHRLAGAPDDLPGCVAIEPTA